MNFRSPELAAAVHKLHGNVRCAPASAPSVAYVASVVWPELANAAYYGLAGDVVRIIEPHSEADPVALLLQFLTAAGNLKVESDRHCPNIFSVMVGDSSKARKGTSWGARPRLGLHR